MNRTEKGEERLIRKGFAVVLALLLIAAAWIVPSAQVVQAEEPARVLQEVHFTMDDGTDLAGSVFLPPATVKMPPKGFPMVVLIHGWGGKRSDFQFPQMAQTLAQDGFVALTYDVRGFGQSQGQAAVASNREIKDLHNLMRLMLENRSSLGNNASPVYPQDIVIDPNAIGTTGISYGGGHSYRAAAANYDPETYVLPTGMTVTNPREQLQDSMKYPKVAAIAPIVGWTDLYQALMPNDVFKLSYTAGLLSLSLGRTDPVAYQWLTWATTGTNRDKLKQDLKERSVLQDGKLTNPNLQENTIEQIPIYMIQGWEDYLFPVEQALILYSVLKDKNPNLKLYLGNTGHPPASISADTPEAHYLYGQIQQWFEYWLKGERNRPIFKTRVEVAPEPGTYDPNVTAADWGQLTSKWDDLPVTRSLTFYLQSGQRLTAEQPSFPQLQDVIVNNPLNGIENDPIVNTDALIATLTGSTAGTVSSLPQPLNLKVGNAYYYSAPLQSDVTVFGQPSLQIYAASGVNSIMLTGKIYDIAPDGTAKLMTRGVTRQTAASGLTPSLVSFHTFADYHRYAKGHRIAIELAASDFPSYQSDLTNAVTQLFHDNSLPSKIVFPVLPH